MLPTPGCQRLGVGQPHLLWQRLTSVRVGLVIGAVLAVGLAGCDPGSSAGRAADRANTPSSLASPSPVSACTPSGLSVIVDRQIPLVDGFSEWVFALTDRRSRPCSVGGFPTLRVTDSTKAVVQVTQSLARRSAWWRPEPTRAVVLSPNHPASFDVVYGSDPGANCTMDYEWTQVAARFAGMKAAETADADGSSTHLAFAPCAGSTLTISPIHRGAPQF